MRYIVIILLAVLFSSCTRQQTCMKDPINRLVKDLNSTNGKWINGIYSPILLPADSSPETVLKEALREYGYTKGSRRINTYLIREVRDVEINVGNMYTFSAVFVETDVWRKILLFRQDEPGQWWTRFYDISDE